jgi:hypothetical protein
MDKWLKDILPDKNPYHNRGRDQMRKKGGPEYKNTGSMIVIKIVYKNFYLILTVNQNVMMTM